ncbi:MAG TPA: MmcQ/YjbR family DNA-binding protein [Gemmatales bacterium]|nr:MmcQ/YjbR family DNA-binding protein [Gemmatales bacterium]
MTAAKFRSLALSMPETVEAEHMNHPDFRVGSKIFATLGWPDARHGMVKLTPVQQAAYVHAHPAIFEAIDNAWGRKGATSVVLKAAKVEILMQALKDAWMNTAPKKLISLIQED